MSLLYFIFVAPPLIETIQYLSLLEILEELNCVINLTNRLVII
jgi:hypothetical protein